MPDNSAPSRRLPWRHILNRLGWFFAALPFAVLALEGALRLTEPPEAASEPPALFAPDQETVFNLRPNLDVVWRDPEFEYRVVTNSLGLREDREVAPKKPGEFRILIVGDSTIFGHGANAEDAIPRRLEALLNKRSKPRGVEFFTVWNAGVVGFRAGQSAANLIRLLDVVDPDVAILGLSAAFSFQQSAGRPEDVIVENGAVVPAKTMAADATPWPQRAEIWLRRHSRLWGRLRQGASPKLEALGFGADAARNVLEPDPSGMRPVYEVARDAALEAWTRGVPTLLLFIPDIAQANEARYQAIAKGRLNRWLGRRPPDRFHMQRYLGIWTWRMASRGLTPPATSSKTRAARRAFFLWIAISTPAG
jgi:hypothetical protein